MPAVPRSPVLVGRTAEVAVATRLLHGVAAGRGATLLVTGEAGIGKSRLTGELAARAGAAGLTVRTGRAVEGGGTYRAVAEALAPLLRDRGREGLPPGIRGLLPGGAGSAAAAPAGIDQSVLLGEAVLALVAGQPTVLVLEDLHWADADTLGLVAYLADAVADRLPLLLALTARTEGPIRALAALAAQPSVTTLELSTLDAGGVAALAAACRGGTPPAEAELADLVARSDGLPFLVEELLAVDRAAVPPTLAGLVEGRLAGLPPAARPVVLAAAVVGTDPDWRLLAEITGSTEESAVAALRAATAAGLLVAHAGRLRWRHALTRGAVLATLLPPEHAAIAGAAARVLDGRDPAVAAELYLTAGRPDLAATVLVDLARRDAARGALRSAADLLDRAAAAGGPVGVVAIERVRVLTQLGLAADALDVGTAVLDAGGLVGDEHAELCLRLARAAVVGGRWAAAHAWLHRAGRRDDPRSLVLAADAWYGAGDVDRAAEPAAAAVRAAEEAMAAGGATAEQAATLCEALLVLGRSCWRTSLDEPEAVFRRAAQVASEHGLTPWRVEALFSLGSAEMSRGDARAASLLACGELARRAGTLVQAVQADILRSEGALLVDGPRAGRPLAEGAAELAGRLRLTALQAIGELIAAANAALAGDGAAAEALLAAANSRPDAPREVVTCTPVVRALPHLLAHDLRRAAALVDEGITPLLDHGSAAPTAYFGLWVLLRTITADRDVEARERLRSHHVSQAAHNRAALAYADSIAAGRAGDVAGAAERLAAVDAAIAHMPWWSRLLRLFALEAAVVDGWGDPVPALRADLAAHEQAGDPALARTCRDLLRAAGAPTRRRGTAPVPPALRRRGVTGREAEVLALVADGLTNAEVARRLYLSPRTVETHVANLLAKTGAAGRAELRAWAQPTVPG